MKDTVQQTIELTVQGETSDGKPLSLENTDLETLQKLLKQVEDIIGEGRCVPIRLETGSIHVTCILTALAATVSLADIDHYRRGNFDAITNTSRLKALQKMDRDARKKGREYSITSNGKEYLRMNKGHYKASKRSCLLDMETELEGIVLDAGGGGQPNIHLETSRGKYTVSATRDQLSKIEGNILYKRIRLAVACKYDLTTNTTRDYVLKSIVELSDTIDEEAINAVMAHGTEAWKDVEDPHAWITELRGEDV